LCSSKREKSHQDTSHQTPVKQKKKNLKKGKTENKASQQYTNTDLRFFKFLASSNF